MAKVLGQPGRYVTEQFTKKLQAMIITVMLSLSLMMFFCGYLISIKTPYSPLLLILFAGALFIGIGNKVLKRHLEQLETERINFRKGAVGEAIVGYVLENFPDDFRIIHDLATPHGNIDHVVIGPTGVYVIDAKNWRGIVSSDGNGGLLLNGKPTDKPEAKNLARMIMNMKEKVKTLCDLDPYVQGVIAFPSAYVDAKWGTTGAVRCMIDEKLYDYIVENKRPKKMTEKEVDAISHAFLALARMDKGFEKEA
jgi:hypothetical protein